MKTKQTIVAWSLQWRPHQDSDKRVWRTDWFSDQFEILSPEEFMVLEKMCLKFGIHLDRAEDED